MSRDETAAITSQVVAEHGLSEEEYSKILGILDREPTLEELGVFSAMWSEHCGYKNSRVVLRRLPTEALHVLQGPGENAGAVDIGEGLAAVLKMESHNHPSAIEPYQGAATGVGGILRDIFTMGAQPIALLDSLRFGPLDEPRNRYLFTRVVAGIADYGNSVGIPTVGGEVSFDPAYRGNPLVNVMCVGVARHADLMRGRAEGAGNRVYAIGNRTGRDGLHGATFASAELTEESEERRPAVQVGDPFTQKLLMEASLEMIRHGWLSGIQDMGAAGLTSSASEMAARAGSGIVVALEKVPLREGGMTPYEILLSESQERMLLVTRTGCEDQVEACCRKWDLQFAWIGEVTGDGLFRARFHGDEVCRIPLNGLIEGCPAYTREAVRPTALDELHRSSPRSDERAIPPDRALLVLLSSPSIAEKRWVFEQYETMVRTNTFLGPGGDAAVLRVPSSEKGLAVTTDVNSRYVFLEPRLGAAHAVAEAARNLSVTGARPLALTDCLNFGNPYDPEVFYTFKEAVEGIREAALALEIPVVSGNVSFYNESPEGTVYPTPTIGMVGVLDRADGAVGIGLKTRGDLLYLLGDLEGTLGGSEYLAALLESVAGSPPALDLDRERAVQEACRRAARSGLLRSAHDVSDGGLGVALAEMLLAGPSGLGLGVALPWGLDPILGLFGEGASRILVAVHPAQAADLEKLAGEFEVPWHCLGEVTGQPSLVVQGLLAVERDQLVKAYQETIPRAVRGR